MAKSADAFRTISEVADWLDTPAHVLRFWESKFSQIKPVKRAGGRRYYRPDDMDLLGGIKALLHDQGMTIKGVQKLLREQGVKHVAGYGPSPLDDSDVIEGTLAPPVAVKAGSGPNMPPPFRVASDPATDPDPTPEPQGIPVPEPDNVPEPEPATIPDPGPDVVPNPEPSTIPELKPDNVVPMSVQIPPDQIPTNAPAPQAAPDNRALAVAALLRDLPADPGDDDFNPRSRFHAAFQRADPDKLAARAARIAPLLTRLSDLRAGMGRD